MPLDVVRVHLWDKGKVGNKYHLCYAGDADTQARGDITQLCDSGYTHYFVVDTNSVDALGGDPLQPLLGRVPGRRRGRVQAHTHTVRAHAQAVVETIMSAP